MRVRVRVRDSGPTGRVVRIRVRNKVRIIVMVEVGLRSEVGLGLGSILRV